MRTDSGREALLEQVTGRLDTARHIDALGGFVDPVHVTKLMIDYIDKRGQGRLGVAAD